MVPTLQETCLSILTNVQIDYLLNQNIEDLEIYNLILTKEKLYHSKIYNKTLYKIKSRGLEPKDIDLIKTQLLFYDIFSSLDEIVTSLRKNDEDIVDTIMDLTSKYY